MRDKCHRFLNTLRKEQQIYRYICGIMQYNASEAGIYLHIPFCHKACHYCNFHFSTSLQRKPELVHALLQEIGQRRDYLQGKPIRSVYFGGGTPSLLSDAELRSLMDGLHRHFTILPEAEITLEANPEDITTAAVHHWISAGINRLSIGIQSFSDPLLQWMNRNHSGQDAETCILKAQDAGIHNLSADLIYGIPGLTDGQWEEDSWRLVELEVPHISAYALTVEPKTALAHQISTGKVSQTDDAQGARQFHLLRGWLQQSGYAHYEISNYARDGRMAVHNTGYWLGQEYLGLGPSAHSFNGHSRQWNIANNARYIALVEQGGGYTEREELDPYTRMNERIMTSLRTMWGLDLDQFGAAFGEAYLHQLLKEAESLIAGGQVEVRGSRMHVLAAYMFTADSVISQLFFVD